MKKPLVSIVIPCYNEQEMIPIINEELNRVAQKLETYEFSYTYVDDGSADATLLRIKEQAMADPKVHYISFSRNFGKEAAIYAGLKLAGGDYTVLMDADLQDPPSLLPDMLSAVAAGECDCAAARRVNRKGEPPIRSFCAGQFYKWMRRLTGIEVRDGARDYRVMNRIYREGLLSMGEYNRFSKGMFGWVGYRTKWFEYENVERAAGETKWSFWKLVRYSLDGIMNFSSIPLTISSYLGLFLTVFSFAAILFVVVRKIVFGDPVSGWPSLVCIITFIGGIQLFCMGIMGQYLARTYMEVKKRPLYLVREENLISDGLCDGAGEAYIENNRATTGKVRNGTE